MVGKTISHYTIVEKLGEGGMGVVYKAHDTTLDRFVSLKFLPAHATVNDETKVRFTQEAKAAAALNHPNICTIHGVDEADGILFIVMEYIDGGTLRNKVPFQKVDDALTMAIQIGEALHEAHSKGIVHRDVKADNIMLTSKGQIKVMDFGLAKLKGSLKLTRTSSTVGTLAYMAPEQIQGGEVDHRSDIFSFGVLLFEMLTGKFPFRGEHEAALLYSIVNEEPEAIVKRIPDASPALQQVFEKAFEKDPEMRYHSIDDMVVDLRRILKQSSKVNRPAYSGEYKKIETDKHPTTSPERSAEAKSLSSKMRLIIYGGAGIAVIILSMLTYTVFLNPDPVPFSSTNINRITSTGKIYSAAVSPDGRYVSYTQLDKGKYSLWVKQLATSSNIQIKPPQKAPLADPVFSNDGNFIYFRMADDVTTDESLFKIPVLGGNSVKILSDVQSPISISPDGKKFAFRRVYPSSGNFALVIASIDGSTQKDLIAYKGDLWINGDPSWSPDGAMIATSLGSWEGGYHSRLIGVDVATANMQYFSTQRWDAIDKVLWLSDGKGLVVEGLNINTMLSQIYFVRYPSGEVTKITNDLNSYYSTSLTTDYRTLCTVLNEQEQYLYFVPKGDMYKSTKITTLRNDGAYGLDVSANNEVFYSSRQGGSFDIWMSSITGENQKQITSDEYLEREIDVSSTAKTIVFTSTKSGIQNIWSVLLDGSGLKQLTKDAEDYRGKIDPNGMWVVFDSWLRGPNTVMKVPLAGGERVDLTTTQGNYPCLTNDGKNVVYTVSDERRQTSTLYSIPLQGGEPKYLFDMPSDAERELVMRPNSSDISYIVTEDGVSNIYVRSLSGGPQRKFTNFNEHFIAQFAWTGDGESLVISRGDVRSDVVIITDERKKPD